MKNFKSLRCVHRHTIEEHPACFAECNLINKKNLPWYKEDGMRMGIIDIETDGLKADFSTMLTWVIKQKDGDIAYDTISKRDLFRGRGDEKIIRTLLKEMSRYKILIGYYNTRFDLPFIRAKALHYGIPFPGFGEIYNFDLYYIVRSKLCISRNSLDNACDYLGIDGKTHIDRNIWRVAKYGDPAALKVVLAHNIADCEITEALYEKLVPFKKWIRTSI